MKPQSVITAMLERVDESLVLICPHLPSLSLPRFRAAQLGRRAAPPAPPHRLAMPDNASPASTSGTSSFTWSKRERRPAPSCSTGPCSSSLNPVQHCTLHLPPAMCLQSGVLYQCLCCDVLNVAFDKERKKLTKI